MQYKVKGYYWARGFVIIKKMILNYASVAVCVHSIYKNGNLRDLN